MQKQNTQSTPANTTPANTTPAQSAKGNYAEVRFIVRGRIEANGAILRAVRSVEVAGDDVAECMQNAMALGEAGVFAEMAAGRKFVETTTTTIYPPVGLLCRGGVSKGFGALPDGSIAFVSRTHKAGEPAPAAVVAKLLGTEKAADAAQA